MTSNWKMLCDATYSWKTLCFASMMNLSFLQIYVTVVKVNDKIYIRMVITIIKIVIWRGISLVLWVRINVLWEW